MVLGGVLANPVLVGALLAWALAQSLKLPIHYYTERSWDWSLLLRAGGMPSSHSAIATAGAHGLGLTLGFDSGEFALGVVIALIVIYDATGIRREAGFHAEVINTIVQDLLEGHPLSQEQLREVLGHSPIEAFIGFLLGLVVSQLVISNWPLLG